MTDLQPEIVTFLFTDVEGSTRLWEAQPRAMSVALARHDALLHAAIATADGTVFKTVGDAFCAAFATPEGAIAAAVAGQKALADEAPDALTPLKVRMAIHSGLVERRAGDYFGPPLNRVARLLATAHGEQIVVSQAAGDLARDNLPPGITLRGLGAHALKDLLDAEHVYQVIAPGLPTDFPPLRTPQRYLRNVPHPATPLIGREREIATARAALGLSSGDSQPDGDLQTTRLLTLTGPGGAGKTRLSLHLAADLGAEFTDGAAFVPLADVTNPVLVPVAIASALDLGDTSGEPPRGLVFAHLRDRHLLLVLDNFEQVMSAAPLVADLLSGCPRLHVVATSRERLSLRGEQELPLPPLALPKTPRRATDDTSAEEVSAAIEEVRRAEAVRLFVSRAQSVKPGFEITAGNATAVAEICSRLDGLPLAIELAAARSRLLSPDALLSRFDRRLDLLDCGPRDLPARQQTMRDTIAWSYDLLDPDEQRLFTHLSIFAGGATLEAAAAITGDQESGGGMADLALVESLADKSLVQLTGDEPRIRMLQTIRDFGQERLAESPERQVIAQRHAAYFLALAEESEQLLAGSEQTRWLDLLEREQANLRAAVDWLRDEGQIEEALRLGGALWRFWWLRGDIEEGRHQLESLLAQSALVSPAVRAKALNGAGVLAESQGDWDTATRLHEESLEISRQIGDQRGVAWSLNNLGVVAINRGDYTRAHSLLLENLAVAERADETASIATALNDLGLIAHSRQDYDEATSLWTRSLALFRTLGDESHVARALNNLGTVAMELGEYRRAQDLFSESLALHRHVGDRQATASTLNNLAEAASSLGDAESAMGLFRESHSLALEGGNRLYAAIAMENLAALTRLQGEELEGVAQSRFREALRLYRSVGDKQGIASCLAGLAAAAAGQGRATEAAALLGAAARICDTQDGLDLPGLAEAVDSLRSTMGDEAFEAAWHSGRAMAIDQVMDQIAAQTSSVPPHLSPSS
ncbi:MAG: adenylate/guanylate cyclase protein [Thermomicrobiales bacterium]|nr:adenylate/guanylate cyclase protein [Thermomicrobiales bacterium]